MKKAVLTAFILILVFTLVTCTKDKGEPLPFTEPCEEVSFANEIKPLIDTNCIVCHDVGNTNGVLLDQYSNIRAFIDNNAMYNAVVKNKTMPQGATLTDAQIKKFRCWIESGAPEN